MFRHTKVFNLFFIGLTTLLICIACNEITQGKVKQHAQQVDSTVSPAGKSMIVYQSEDLVIQKHTDHVYQHTSFLSTQDFGKVDCNGMIIVNENEAVVFDTPADNKSAEALVSFLRDSIETEIKAVIPTHFHEDCVGGIETFHVNKIPIHVFQKTIGLLNAKGRKMPPNVQSFNDSMDLQVGNKKVQVRYFGEGHTADNIVGIFPDGQAIFGGCLVKETGAGKGNLEDANTKAWPGTISKLKQRYPGARIVIPGHGKYGGSELFDYTIQLFQK